MYPQSISDLDFLLISLSQKAYDYHREEDYRDTEFKLRIFYIPGKELIDCVKTFFAPSEAEIEKVSAADHYLKLIELCEVYLSIRDSYPAQRVSLSWEQVTTNPKWAHDFIEACENQGPFSNLKSPVSRGLTVFDMVHNYYVATKDSVDITCATTNLDAPIDIVSRHSGLVPSTDFLDRFPCIRTIIAALEKSDSLYHFINGYESTCGKIISVGDYEYDDSYFLPMYQPFASKSELWNDLSGMPCNYI